MLNYQLRLHAIVLIFGFTGILGKLIGLPSELIVLYRTSIATLVLLVYLRFLKKALSGSGRDNLTWLSTGLLVGLHWFLFFQSIKLSNVSVALVSLSSTALFTSILEPILYKKKVRFYELIFSVVIIAGMAIVLRFEFRYWQGILCGVSCALLAALFTVINSRLIEKSSAVLISFYELIGATLFSIIFIPIYSPSSFLSLPTIPDFTYLIFLGVVATAIAFVVSIEVMRKLSPFTVSLTINLEPLYGIILAVMIFGEEELMSPGFYVGFLLILSTILVNAYVKKKERKIAGNFGKVGIRE